MARPRRPKRPPPEYRVVLLPPDGPPNPEAERKVLEWFRDRARDAATPPAPVGEVQAEPRPARPPAPPPLDTATLRELERRLAARLDALAAYGPGCASCRDAKARAFLAHLRGLLAAQDGQG